jgi:hypothetical protein
MAGKLTSGPKIWVMKIMDRLNVIWYFKTTSKGICGLLNESFDALIATIGEQFGPRNKFKNN